MGILSEYLRQFPKKKLLTVGHALDLLLLIFATRKLPQKIKKKNMVIRISKKERCPTKDKALFFFLQSKERKIKGFHV